MRRSFALVLAVAVALPLAACGRGGGGSGFDADAGRAVYESYGFEGDLVDEWVVQDRSYCEESETNKAFAIVLQRLLRDDPEVPNDFDVGHEGIRLMSAEALIAACERARQIAANAPSD
jgi:hypothetical protein